MAEIILAYRRNGGEFYIADIFVDGISVWAANGVSFARLIESVSTVLNEYPDASLVFRRTDRPGLIDLHATQVQLDEIRKHHLEYIRRNTFPDRKIIVREPVAPVLAQVSIQAGYDALADSFGEYVYSRHRDDGKIECPCCGRWFAFIHNGQLGCECSGRLGPASIHGSWAEISTASLLSLLHIDRFYLPRAWNTAGSWVGKETLIQLFTTFKKESRDV